MFSQTLDDLEFIFIDDCSPDRSMALMQQVLESFPGRRAQVRCLRMDVNSGQAAVRMRGIGEASGDYLAFFDSDDTVPPEACKMLYDCARRGSHDMVTCDFMQEDSGGHWLRKCGRLPSGSELDALLYAAAPWNLACRLIRRSVLCDGVEAPAGNMGEDMVITIQAVMKSGSIGHVDAALYYYHYRSSSTSREPGAEAALSRTRALQANVSLLVNKLCSDGRYSEDSPQIVAFKYYSRHCLEPFVGDAGCYRRWKAVFPEVDKRLLWTPGVKAETKFWFCMIHLRLYAPLKRITSLFR